MDEYEHKILKNWEEVYKKGLLTLWILLALLDGEKRMADIKLFIEHHTEGNITADDKSMYRALRRYYDTDLINYTTQPGKGPEVKLYKLTPSGRRVLKYFLKRNILNTFFTNDIHKLIIKGAK